MRGFLPLLWCGWVLLALSGCQGAPADVPPPPPVPSTAEAQQTPTPQMVEITSIPLPTPATVTLTVWGPAEVAPGEGEGGALLAEHVAAFEEAHPAITVLYEPKALDGPAGLLTYLRTASAVAPDLVPDLVILPSALVDEAAQTGLLFPLDSTIARATQEDLYPFATRDTRSNEQWLAVPLAVQVEHGVTRAGQSSQLPLTLDRMVRPDAPTWLLAAQAGADGQMTNALLLQLFSILERPDQRLEPPQQESLLALLATFQAAQRQGSIPRLALSISDEALLYESLAAEQADFIESGSHAYLRARAGDERARLAHAPVPTLTGTMTTVVSGYVVALSTSDSRQQEAAALYLEWLLDAERLGEWYRVAHWLPARRSALPQVIDDAGYRTFLHDLLESGRLRPGGSAWVSFAQAMQEQFRAVMTDQLSPQDATETILQSFPP